MRTYRAIIVEDEQLPMLSLIQKLNEYHPDIEVAGTCGDTVSAMEMILKIKPDVLFIDIRLSDNDSLSLLEQLQTSMEKLPYIIFTTAYNDSGYMFKAIRFQAVDYLLKPVNIVDLAKAITRMKEKANKNSDEKIAGQTYSFRTFNSTTILTAEDIVYIEADGNYCNLFTAQHTEEPVFERLGEVEARLLPSGMFVRAGKSHLINKKHIYKIDTKKHICILKSLTDKFYEVNVSANGIAALQLTIDN
jgi:two-component system LytT family response regulator